MTTNPALLLLSLSVIACGVPSGPNDEYMKRNEQIVADANKKRQAEEASLVAAFSAASFTARLSTLDALVKKKDWVSARKEYTERWNDFRSVAASSRRNEPEIKALWHRMMAADRLIAEGLQVANRARAARNASATPATPEIERSTCGVVHGESASDVAKAKMFCARFVPSDLGVTGVRAYQSLLWIQVSRELANVMRLDRLSTEQIIKNWMRAWKALSGSASVVVYVLWQDVEIAKGDTSLFAGDVVTIK